MLRRATFGPLGVRWSHVAPILSASPTPRRAVCHSRAHGQLRRAMCRQRRALAPPGSRGILGMVTDAFSPASSAAKEITHSRDKVLPFSCEQMCDIVSDVDSYQEFLPFCTHSRITRHLKGTSGGHSSSSSNSNSKTPYVRKCHADLTIGFRVFTETYTSVVTVEWPRLVKAQSIRSSLFESMETIWSFAPGPSPNTCRTRFQIKFRVASSLHAHAVDLFFQDVAQRQMQAFETRCRTRYGGASASGVTPRSPLAPKPQQLQQTQQQQQQQQQRQAEQIETVADATGSKEQPEPARPKHKFTEDEISKLHNIFMECTTSTSTSSLREMSKEGFLRMCASVQTPGTVFPRYRDRYTVLAAAALPALAETLYTSGSFHEPMTGEDFLERLHYLTKASPREKAEEALRVACAGRERVPVSVLAEASRRHFRTQLDVVEYVMPGMVYKRIKALEQEFPVEFGDVGEQGVHMLGLLSLMGQVVRETEEAVMEGVQVLSEQIESPCSADQWMQGWTDSRARGEVLDVMSVAGLSRTIHWASAVSDAHASGDKASVAAASGQDVGA